MMTNSGMDIKFKMDLDDLVKKYLYKSPSLALISHTVKKYGTLELKFGEINDKIFVVATLKSNKGMYNTDVIRVEGDAFFSIEDSILDAIYKIYKQGINNNEGEI